MERKGNLENISGYLSSVFFQLKWGQDYNSDHFSVQYVVSDSRNQWVSSFPAGEAEYGLITDSPACSVIKEAGLCRCTRASNKGRFTLQWPRH